MAECIFCKIVAKELPSRLVYEDDDIIAFNDLNARAPLHVLVVPRRHVERLSDLDDAALAGKLALVAARIARDAGHGDNFRLVVNNGAGAGQSVFHLHFHVLGGRQFTWPPG
ncbi:MAG: histidine triad nucleotide-binding protein [Chloroflexi bacterium]|nr:MAG: histidine triad nucleotide-binding protein [Chloroflexota bacterium]